MFYVCKFYVCFSHKELNHWKRKYNKQQDAMARLNTVYKAEKKSNKEKQSQIKLLQKQVNYDLLCHSFHCDHIRSINKQKF